MSKLLLLCEGAFVALAPDEPVPTFEIQEEYKEVVLISGEVRCLNSRERLTAPAVVPRNVRSADSCLWLISVFTLACIGGGEYV